MKKMKAVKGVLYTILGIVVAVLFLGSLLGILWMRFFDHETFLGCSVSQLAEGLMVGFGGLVSISRLNG